MPAGRPKSFDEQTALEAAMEVFWLRGYDGTALSHLLERMQISRQSLYDTFGSKRELFLRTIEHYRSTKLSEGLALLEREESPIENIRALLGFFEELALDKRCRGCLVANALVELGPHDEEIAGVLQETLSVLEAAVEKTLVEAQHANLLGGHKSPRQLARALTNAMLGMAVTGKLPVSRAALRDVYAGTVSMLD